MILPNKELFDALAKLIPAPKKDSGYGRTTSVMYAASDDPAAEPESTGPTDIDSQINELITTNPGISGPTLLNLLKAQGFEIIKKESVTEADGGSSFPQVTRESAAIEMGNLSIRAHFKESNDPKPGVDYTGFDVVLLQEGLGNLKDGYYYTREAIESAVTVFEGKKIYANHPSADEEQLRPERDVRDILGHFEGVHMEEHDGRAMLCGRIIALSGKPYEWARELMKQSVAYAKKYPDKEFVGLSINASGDAVEESFEKFVSSSEVPEQAKVKLANAREQGLDTLRIVSKITDAVSCDLVTEAGAGGKIRSLMEQNKEKVMAKKHKESLEPGKTGPSLKASETEMEKKEAVPGQEEAPHDDAAQDIELIKKMMKKSGIEMGEADVSDDDAKHMKSVAEACMSQGMDEAEAMKCAHYGMKAAKAMQSYEKKESAESEESEESKEADVPTIEKKESESESKMEAHKESAKLAAENSVLKERLAKIETENYLDAELRKIKESRQVTDQIRTLIGTPKNKAHVDGVLKSFMEGLKAARGGESADGFDFYLGGEKTEAVTSGDASFADCASDF